MSPVDLNTVRAVCEPLPQLAEPLAVRMPEAPASCKGILHPLGGDASPGRATAECTFASANSCLQHYFSARECSLGLGSPQLS